MKSAYRILVVDDEECIRAALTRTLSKEGYEVDSVSRPSEALQRMAVAPADLVLSDHLMPEMTGLELMKTIRTRYPDCIRMILTGHADVDVAIHAINVGEVYRFVRKPWDDAELKVSLFIAFEQLDLLRQNRRLLQELNRQKMILQYRQGEQRQPVMRGALRGDGESELFDG